MSYSDETLTRVAQAIRDAFVDTHDPFGRPWAELEDWERRLLIQHTRESLETMPLQPGCAKEAPNTTKRSGTVPLSAADPRMQAHLDNLASKYPPFEDDSI